MGSTASMKESWVWLRICALRFRMHLFRYWARKALGGMPAEEYDVQFAKMRRKYIPGADLVPICGPYAWGGKYPDKKFLIIRRRDSVAGLFSHFKTNLAWMKYAEDHGLIPIVDMVSVDNLYCRHGRFEDNPWELFFRQSGGFSLLDVREAKNVYVTGECGLDMPTSRMQDLTGPSLARWRGVAQRHCRVADGILEEVVRTERAILGEGSRALGVLLRGTDYLAMHPARHPVQPEIKRAVADVGKAFRAGAWSHIFLVTEDAEIAQAFRQEFGDRVRMTGQEPIRYDGRGYLDCQKGVSGDVRRAREYLVRIIMLSRCSDVMCGRTAGSLGAAILSKGFDSAFYWDLGEYPCHRGRAGERKSE